MVVLIFMLIGSLISEIQCGFFGGTIHWLPLENQKIRIWYTFGFTKASGACPSPCSTASIGQEGIPTPFLKMMKWTCESGCQGDIKTGVNYKITSVGDGTARDWEQGQSFINHDFGPFTGTINAALTRIRWDLPGNGFGKMAFSINLQPRSDTSRINSSPIASLPPYFVVSHGPETSIKIPLYDPDGDVVHCRLATTSECGSMCTDTNYVKINQEKCLVTIETKNIALGNGAYAEVPVTLMAEDMVQSSVGSKAATVMSAVPIQFFIHVLNTTVSKEEIEFPVHVSQAKTTVYQDFSKPFVDKFSIKSPREVILTGNLPVNTNMSVAQDGHQGPDNHQVSIEWTPPTEYEGPYFMCIWGMSTDGAMTKGEHCNVILINGADFCSANNQCSPGDKCINLMHGTLCEAQGCKAHDPCVHGSCEDRLQNMTCVCQDGFTGSICDTKLSSCDQNPCHNSGTCFEKADSFVCSCPLQYTGYRCESRLPYTPFQQTANVPKHGKSSTSGLQSPTVSVTYTLKDDTDQKSPSGNSNKNVHLENKNHNVVNIDVSSPKMWPIAVGIGGGFLLLLGGVAAAICCKMNKPPLIVPGHDASRRFSSIGDSLSRDDRRNSVTVTKTNNHVVTNNHVRELHFKDALPQVYNIYRASQHDPFLHSCNEKDYGFLKN